MTYRGGSGFRGRGNFRGKNNSFRGGRGNFNTGPPEKVEELGTMMHVCQEDVVCKCTNEKVPYFNAPIYLENKSQIGKVDEIFGQIREFYFSVKMSENMQAASFSKDTKFFIDPSKLLPLSRFIAPPAGKVTKRGGPKGRGGFKGGNRGSRGGGFRGGSRGGGFKGGSRGRGGFQKRGGGGGFRRGGSGGFRGRGKS